MGGLLAAFSTMATACWGGDGTGESDDSDAAYESYARALCIAQRQLGETLLPQVTPGAGPPVEAMITVWEEFIEALEDAEPPLSLQAFHAEWLEMQRDDLATLRVTGHTNYWIDHAPELSDEQQERLEAAAARVPECDFPIETPPATATPATSGSPSPPATPTMVAAPIDYADPTRYTAPGSQSTLSSANAAAVRAELGELTPNLEAIGIIARWLRTSFRTEPSGGATIGKTDVNTLIESRALTGCHDGALVLSTILRLYGIPALMVDTAAIQWADEYRAGQVRGFTGHVFVEAYVDGWILVECGWGQYTADYDPADPVIPAPMMPDPRGYYVLYKGVDPAAYGVTDNDALTARMAAFARESADLDLSPPEYRWQALPAD